MIIQGHSNGRIAEALFIERKTVKNHINSIYSKLRLNSRYEAITRALSQRRREEENLAPQEVGRVKAKDRVHPLP
jgi:DNA-binding NarL/FixJ family response regulator